MFQIQIVCLEYRNHPCRVRQKGMKRQRNIKNLEEREEIRFDSPRPIREGMIRVNN